MAHVSETKVESLVVELKKDDVRDAIIKAARSVVDKDHMQRSIDDGFVPQLVEDGFGGFKVYFKAADPKAIGRAA